LQDLCQINTYFNGVFNGIDYFLRFWYLLAKDSIVGKTIFIFGAVPACRQAGLSPYELTTSCARGYDGTAGSPKIKIPLNLLER